ncbi:hypothetical protein PSYPI_48188, partial [Pseudomonas syringae pv. pisi str. 1704B]
NAVGQHIRNRHGDRAGQTVALFFLTNKLRDSVWGLVSP